MIAKTLIVGPYGTNCYIVGSEATTEQSRHKGIAPLIASYLFFSGLAENHS